MLVRHSLLGSMKQRSAACFLVAALMAVCGCSGNVVDGEGETAALSASCESFSNEPPAAQAVSMSFQNHRDGPIFLSHWKGCGHMGSLYNAKAPSGATMGPPSFGASCEWFQDNPDYPITGCETIEITAIAPGSSISLSWKPLIYEHVQMPAACYAGDAQDHDFCTQALTAAAGTYTFTGLARTGAKGCSQYNACACEGPVQGTCTADEYNLEATGDYLTATAVVDYPTSAYVELIFE